MAVPGFQDFMLPILKLAAEKDTLHKTAYDEALANGFGLSDDDRNELLPSGKQKTYQNRIGWAISYLVKALLLERPARATIRITKRGRDLLSENPERVDLALMMRYPEFRKFRLESTRRGPKLPPVVVEEPDVSPLERLEAAHSELRTSLASDLLETILQAPPEFFEQLVVDVLVKMGYGGTLKDAGQAIGKSGDGGIDGVIKEDRLGLESIYIQAKRWQGNVQTPEIQKFVGALMGRGANRGVFITSSDFTSGARSFVKQIQTKIVLISGQELADLMIEYGVGVIDEQTYRVKRVDPEYFGE